MSHLNLPVVAHVSDLAFCESYRSPVDRSRSRCFGDRRFQSCLRLEYLFFQSRRVIEQPGCTLCFPYVVINFIQLVYLARAILFHVLDKELVGSNSSLGQVHIQLKYLDLDEPITKRYPLADLVSSSSVSYPS